MPRTNANVIRKAAAFRYLLHFEKGSRQAAVFEKFLFINHKQIITVGCIEFNQD